MAKSEFKPGYALMGAVIAYLSYLLADALDYSLWWAIPFTTIGIYLFVPRSESKK